MGGREIKVNKRSGSYDVTPYQTTHTTGGAIIGSDPGTSALNRYLQSWDVPNVFVPGANAFRAIGRVAFAAYLFGLIGGLVGVQAFLTDRVPRPKTRAALFALIAGLMILEQVRPFPESFDKRAEFFDRAQSLVPHMAGADVVYVIDDGSMPDYRHQVSAMWAGLWAKVPVMNGFSGTQPIDYPGMNDHPTVEELVRALGPYWRGRLAVIEWGPPVRRRVYQVELGGRFRLIESS